MFEQALDLILSFEGGYSNNPNDPGGKTNYGITQRTYDPTNKKDVKYITPGEVNDIYKNNYWLAGRCDKIDSINPGLATIHFDACVNCGDGAAARMLQDILEVPQDGIIGPITLSKIIPGSYQQIKYLNRRKNYYNTIIQNRPASREFKGAWYNRLNSLAKESGIIWKANEA